MTTAGVIRIVLVVDIVAMALFALIYLRQRRMSWVAYCCWGFVALLLPVLGPFLLISNRPGEWHPDPFPSAQLRQRVKESIRMYCNEFLLPFVSVDMRKKLRKYTRRARYIDSNRYR